MSIRYVDAAERTGLQTLPCDPDRIARGFRSNERLFILPRRTKFHPVFRGLDPLRGRSQFFNSTARAPVNCSDCSILKFFCRWQKWIRFRIGHRRHVRDDISDLASDVIRQTPKPLGEIARVEQALLVWRRFVLLPH